VKPFLLSSLAFLLASQGSVPAQEGKEAVIRSESGQFIIHAAAPTAHRLLLPQLMTTSRGEVFLLSRLRGARNPEEQPIHLDPSSVAFACERVKQSLLATLDLRDDWSGQIHLFLDSAVPGGQVLLDTIATDRGWLFRLALPREMRELDLDRMILHAVLLERSNRNPAAMANNIPKWLTEGLIRCMRAAAPDGLSVQSQTPLEFRRGAAGPLTTSIPFRPAADVEARSLLHGRQPLSFEEMCWPDSLDTEKAALFAVSAELFVHELLKARDGRECVAGMLLKSTAYLNWQFAFLDAFQGHFRTLVEVEKWWSLAWTRLLGVDASQLWVSREAWEKLEFCLRATIETRAGAQGIPSRKMMTLQAVIRELPLAAERAAMETALFQLSLVERRVPPRLAALDKEYQQVIQVYLADTTPGDRSVLERHPAPFSLNVSKQTAEGKLDLLDRKRAKLKAEMRSPGESASLSP
jgi:hypothetical protein